MAGEKVRRSDGPGGRVWTALRLALLVAVLAVAAGTLHHARADDDTLTTSVTNAAFGQKVTVTALLHNPAGTVSLTVFVGTWSSANVSSGEQVAGVGTRVISVNLGAAPGVRSFTGTYTCTTAGSIYITLAGVNSSTATTPGYLQTAINCSATGVPFPSCTSYTLNFSSTGSATAPCASACPAINSTLLGPSTSPCSYPYPSSNGFSCPYPGANPISSPQLYNTNPTPPYPAYSYPYPSGVCATPVAVAAAPTPVALSQVSLSPDSSNLNCGASTLITITGRDSSGNALADSSAATLSASLGTLSSTQTTLNFGYGFASYTAPASGGTATISATVGGISGSTSVNVTCGAQSGGSSPSVALPASAPPGAASLPAPASSQSATSSLSALPQPGTASSLSATGSSAGAFSLPPASLGGVVFKPPNTGDGGLLEAGGPERAP